MQPGPVAATPPPWPMPRWGKAKLQKSRSEEMPRQLGRAEPFKETATRFRLESANGGWEGSSYLQVTDPSAALPECWCERC